MRVGPIESHVTSGLDLRRLLWPAWLATAALLALGALPALGQQPPKAFTIVVPTSHTAQEIVDLADAHPDKYLAMGGSPLVPIGHPSVSNADCVANPNSVGCRISAARALAASQSVVMDKLCIPGRPDVMRKYPGYELDVVNGVPFDLNWLLEIPASEYESRLELWRNGIFFQVYYDFSWVHNHEPICCHNENFVCGPTTQCVMQYGYGDDVGQRFTSVAVAPDMRVAAYQQWSAERVVAQVLDQGADCIGAVYKSGLWSYYGGPDSGRECWQPGGDAIEGPTKNFDPCANIGGAFSPTPYAPGEYEAALNDFFRKVFTELDSAGLPDVEIVSIDRPPALGSTWSWMDPDVRANPHMAGEQSGFNPNPPDPDPPPSIVVYLLPPSPDGTIPHEVDLGADVRGSAEGPIDYHFWCDCSSSTKDLSAALTACGSDPGQYSAVLASNDDPFVLADACQYDSTGTYIVKVLVEREGVIDEDRNALNVDPGPLLTSFHDETFSNINWFHSVLVDTAGGADTLTASVQVPTGGNPDEYQAGDHIWGGAGTVVEGHVFFGPSYDPAIQGEILGVDASLDATVFSTVGGPVSLDVGVLVRQNGSYFSASLGTVVLGAWQSLGAAGLVASDFVLIGGVGNPDFSSAGAPIEFGYALSGTASGAGSSQWGIDNFLVEIVEPPNVPSLGGQGITLLVAAFALIAAYALRRAPSARGRGRSS